MLYSDGLKALLLNQLLLNEPPQFRVRTTVGPFCRRRFSLEERLEQLSNVTNHLPQVQVTSFEGLTVHFALEQNARVILRGLRALSDFEFELQLAHTNASLSDQVDTLFMATAVPHSFLSSSVVKEVARFGGDVQHLVPQTVASDLRRLFNQRVDVGGDR